MPKKTLLLFTLFFISVSTIAQSKTTYTREFSKTINFRPGGKAKIKTINGFVNMTSWNRNSIQIEAEIKVRASSRREADRILDKVEIIIDRRGDRVTIEPDYPKRHRGDSFWDRMFGSGNRPVVNFTIKVPRQTNPELRSTNGRLVVSDIEGDAVLKTTNGKIEAEGLKGSVDARTTNGSISVVIQHFRDDDQLDLSTTNGSIKLSLPSDVAADIKASTVNGSIRTDFPLKVQGRISRKRLNGEINGGGGMIDLSTVNGSISIREE